MTEKSVIRTGFAPDWRAGLPYQGHLAEALKEIGIETEFLSTYRRGLPLTRGFSASNLDILHLHWPEAYFESQSKPRAILRMLRYPLDLMLATRGVPLVLTAHNLFPHDQGDRVAGTERLIRHTMKRAAAVFVHSKSAQTQIHETFGVSPDRCPIIPFGDHALELGTPQPVAEAREKLGLPEDQKICLVFGTVSPYKGSDEIIEAWKDLQIGHRLIVAGPVVSESFAATLRELASGSPSIDLRISDQWLDSAALNDWLSAADVTVFNYRAIFTSGAAALARSFGVPILIPSRLTAADLYEPHPSVFRFDGLRTDFVQKLELALSQSPDYAAAEEWREQTSWKEVARLTRNTYEQVLN